MSEAISSIIGILLVIVLLIFFPLYNIYERQDDAVYEYVLNSTISFVDEVKGKGFITWDMYDKYVKAVANTSVGFNIDMEVYKKQYHVDTSSGVPVAEALYEIDYTKQIRDYISTVSTDPKDNVYILNRDDYFYVKVKSSGITQATLVFNLLGGNQGEGKISVNYGGVVKDPEWLRKNGSLYIPAY